MRDTYDDLITLIKNWKEFRRQFPEGNLQTFGRYLFTGAKDEQKPEETEQFIIDESNKMKERKVIPDLANRAIIGSMLGRLTHFVKSYVKAPFQELGVGSMEEFKILSLISRLKNPNKSMLSQAAIMEFTTINDMLKRLVKKGWVRQVKDEMDKRSSRISLTDEGIVVLKKSYQTLAKIQPSLTGDLSADEQAKLMGFLTRLNQFHSDYYKYHFMKKDKN